MYRHFYFNGEAAKQFAAKLANSGEFEVVRIHSWRDAFDQTNWAVEWWREAGGAALNRIKEETR